MRREDGEPNYETLHGGSGTEKPKKTGVYKKTFDVGSIVIDAEKEKQKKARQIKAKEKILEDDFFDRGDQKKTKEELSEESAREAREEGEEIAVELRKPMPPLEKLPREKDEVVKTMKRVEKSARRGSVAEKEVEDEFFKEKTPEEAGEEIAKALRFADDVPKDEVLAPVPGRKIETLKDLENIKTRRLRAELDAEAEDAIPKKIIERKKEAAKRRLEKEDKEMDVAASLVETRKKIREDRKTDESGKPEVRWARLEAKFPLTAGVFQKLASEYKTAEFPEEIVSLLFQRKEELQKRIAERGARLDQLQEERNPKGILGWMDRKLFRRKDPEVEGLKKIHSADVDLLAEAQREGKKLGIGA